MIYLPAGGVRLEVCGNQKGDISSDSTLTGTILDRLPHHSVAPASQVTATVRACMQARKQRRLRRTADQTPDAPTRTRPVGGVTTRLGHSRSSAFPMYLP